MKHVTEIELPKENGEQNEQKDKLLTTNFEVKVENRKVERPITYSTDQQIFKFKVNSGTDQEVQEFSLIFNQFIVNGQLMPFYSIWVLCHHRKSKCDDERKSQYTIL